MMERNNASFRDEGGYVFHHNGAVFRHINKSFQEHYEFFMSSGLYDELTSKGLLIRHREEDPAQFSETFPSSYKIIRPDYLRWMSFPYEWSFHQLKDAALATLNIQGIALEHGMVLKDASAFNIQFVNGTPCFIDTLSFVKLGKCISPWVAYKQFCEHFLVPLSLMSYFDTRLNLMLRSFADGIPIEVGSELLPMRSYFSLGLFIHVHMHAKFHRKYVVETGDAGKNAKGVSKYSLVGLNESLKKSVRKLQPRKKKTQWASYYRDAVDARYVQTKREIVDQAIARIQPKLVWDVGANNGEYSRIFSENRIEVLSFDIDPTCVDENYLSAKQARNPFLYPLFLNIVDPSPDIGWANRERPSFIKRSEPDLIVAFAIIHHLAISQHITFDLVAELFSSKGKYLLIEFLEIDDPRVREILRFREHQSIEYSKEHFERSFSKYFHIVEQFHTGQKSRIIYVMKSQGRA